ncbi:membrane-bound lytic murein transglycosylase MltF [Ectothiorhodospira sp. 9100]|uniref:membrane-bound lytic murein transglycosylase MltF n=1 Tax=Ectothiorhodospira sp. 9100 TaxID=2897388 RepID=UPI001EE989C4|nr:membrane-bound lytic murein transglycosylase MltF [Ectothiorhodospira sp. 9100]MCG5514647.1 membrane-bound lytic murein transglycosylase MltF [Ectothiorhodospira sp. 9100]
MDSRYIRRLPTVLLLLCLSLWLITGCDRGTGISRIHPDESGVLSVVTRNGPTTYYLDRHERPSGPEYDLVTDFAETHDWEVDWMVVDSTAQVIEALESGQAHLAASGLTHLESRNQRFERGPAHTEVTQQVVCHRDLANKPTRIPDLVGIEIAVTANSSYTERLRALASEHEGLNFREVNKGTERLLGEVAEKALQCTVADANIVKVNRRFMPSLSVAMDLTEGQNLGWYLAQGATKLTEQAFSWMNSREGDEAVDRMERRHYAYITEFDYVDLRTLNRRIEERLPQYKDLFLTAEEETGMPADLLAALSYQESHWNPNARSPTGVRGMMMLTQNTARSLGVTNRLDPEQSILAGARYLEDRHRRLPEQIPEPDRLFLALASYNVGRGHLLDARQLARNLGKNPDSWADMREVLPLLSDERYYPQLRYGYARGYEPVHFVQRVRNYRDVLSQAFD